MEYSFYSEENQFLGYVLKEHYKYGMHFKQFLKKNGVHDGSCVAIEFKKDSKDSVDWEYWLREYRRNRCRSLMPCYDYEKLKIKDIKCLMRYADPMNLLEKVSYPRTVCPYVVKDDKLEWDCSDKVIQWVRENNIKGKDKVTEDDIINEYGKMKKDFEKIVKKLNDEVDKRKAKEEKDKEKKEAKLKKS